jgi:hypothetical protein
VLWPARLPKNKAGTKQTSNVKTMMIQSTRVSDTTLTYHAPFGRDGTSRPPRAGVRWRRPAVKSVVDTVAAFST